MYNLTIVTINFNNRSGLIKTIRSVLEAIDKVDFPVSFLIKDGGSTDGSRAILENLTLSDKVQVVIGPDHGPFNGMNEALEYVTSPFVLMLNSGDTFVEGFDLSALCQGLKSLKDDQLLLGSWKVLEKTFNPGSLDDVVQGKFQFCHQSAVVPATYRYDERLSISADLKMLCEFKKRDRIQYTDQIIARYEGGGISTQRRWKKRVEIATAIYQTFGVLAVLNYLFAGSLRRVGFLLRSLKILSTINK